MTKSHFSRTPAEVLTDTLRGCCNGYVGAPALAVQCVAALRAAGYLIVREGAIGAAQREAVAAYREDNDDAWHSSPWQDNIREAA